MTDTRRCLACGATLTGRADQRYCDSTWRSHAAVSGRPRHGHPAPASAAGRTSYWPKIKWCSNACREQYLDREVREWAAAYLKEHGEPVGPDPQRAPRRRRFKTYLPDVTSGDTAPADLR